MYREAVSRTGTALVLALSLLVAATSTASAQASTGKVQGRVVSATGQPITSAQVTIDGTTLGNITNDEGFYFINEVPAGLHTIRAQSIGYRTVVVSEQRVLAGQTATVNFTLEQAAVELEALIVMGERNPLVPRDQVSSKAIVTGETIDRLPIDNSASIVLLQPGVITTTTGFSIRGSREDEHAAFVDGVPIRRLRTGASMPVELPTNALAQVDVTTGGIAARYGDAQSGVVNYVTRTGGSTYGGTVSLMTDELSPKAWRTGFNRGELSFGGPVPGIRNLTFFSGMTLEGNRYAVYNEGFADVPLWVASGVDTTFVLPRESGTSGALDSVRIDVPNFVRWDEGAVAPTSQSDEYNLTAKLSYGLPGGSKIDLSYYRNRNQVLSRPLSQLFNQDAWRGEYSTEDMVTLGGYFLLVQTAERALALDVRASYQHDWFQAGMTQPAWLQDNLNPRLGFMFNNIDFVLNPNDWPVTDDLINAVRSGVVNQQELIVLADRKDLQRSQGVAGVSSPLRLNPYGMRSSWATSGIGTSAQFESFNYEDRYFLSATADWQMNRFNRVWLGGEMTFANTATANFALFSGLPSIGKFSPRRGGLFIQNRMDIGDVVLDAGLRLEHFDPSGEFPRVPGYVFNVPDSLRADFVRVVPGDGPTLSRLVPNTDCGGDATAANRRRADGTLVCMNNFIPAKTRTTFAPKLAVSFPVTATSTFRVSYGHNVQAPPLTVLGGLFSNNYDDQQGGTANENWQYGRDVEMPRTVAFEAGYRQVFGGATVLDVAAYSKTTRNGLTYRKMPFQEPRSGRAIQLLALTNADYTLARGVDVSLKQRFGEVADLAVNYSFLDAQGTGSDPITYTELLLRRSTNLSIVTGNPVEPPELLLTLDQSRAHNLGGTLSLLFPGDFIEENRLANAVLGELGVFATMRVASGLPFTRLQNQGSGQTGPPTYAGLSGIPAEELNASRTPAEMRFDVRLTKGLNVMGRSLRAFADLRNPFGIANTNFVWLETGRINNELHRNITVDGLLRDPAIGGVIRDFDIRREFNDNPLNTYMMLRAEERFGDGNGIYTVDEQRNAYNAWYDLFNGQWSFREANRRMRLGFEITF